MPLAAGQQAPAGPGGEPMPLVAGQRAIARPHDETAWRAKCEGLVVGSVIPRSPGQFCPVKVVEGE